MNTSDSNTNACRCLTECIDKTDKAKQLTNTNILSIHERQFLLLVSNHDLISAKASSKLLNKLSIESMLATGLLKQNKHCSNYHQLLSQHRQHLKNCPSVEMDSERMALIIDASKITLPPLCPSIELLSGNLTGSVA